MDTFDADDFPIAFKPLSAPLATVFGLSGQFDFTEIDHRASGYIQDKWEISRKLTLNLGVRYDWQNATPEERQRWLERRRQLRERR